MYLPQTNSRLAPPRRLTATELEAISVSQPPPPSASSLPVSAAYILFRRYTSDLPSPSKSAIPIIPGRSVPIFTGKPGIKGNLLDAGDLVLSYSKPARKKQVGGL